MPSPPAAAAAGAALTDFDYVPDAYAWPADDDVAQDPFPSASLPVVDLASPDAADLAGAACEQWGAFLITGHGVSPELTRRVDAQVRRLFALPPHNKLRAARPPDGVSGYGPPPLSAFFPKRMWSEGFTVAGSPADHARRLWPPPHDNSRHFCDAMEEYNKAMQQLAHRLYLLLLQSLGAGDGPIKNVGDVAGVLQLNSYPPCPDPAVAMGLAAHTDSGLLTLLHQNSVDGLQLLRCSDDGEPPQWVTVRPGDGELVVHVGDLMHVLSNGRYRSVVHRAVVNPSEQRISVGYICGPPAKAVVRPVGNGPNLYRAVTWAEYLGLRKKLFLNALHAVKLTGVGDGDAPAPAVAPRH